MTHATEHKLSWIESLLVYFKPRVVGMLFLGFAAGLPFPLVFATLSAWLGSVNISKATIGFFAWVGITYSIKVFWAPVIDRAKIPFLTRKLGQRRSWMLVAQLGIILGLVGMATTDPVTHTTTMALFALLVAFSSATQDISIDAYRIEAINIRYQAAMAAMYIGGWRIAATLVAGAAALYLAKFYSWELSYYVMAASMAVGIVTVLIIREPKRDISKDTLMSEQKVVDFLENAGHLHGAIRVPVAWFIGSVICPFTEFFQRNGNWSLLILLFIVIYRISDIILGNMAYPFYLDMGYELDEIANIAKLFGFIATMLGIFIGGVLVARYNVMTTLLIGAILVASTNLLFSFLANLNMTTYYFANDISVNLIYLADVFPGNETDFDLSNQLKFLSGGWLGNNFLDSRVGLGFVISADNLAGGIATTAFVAYLAKLTNTAYTATQYALFSSLMTLVPKILSGFSGVVVEQTSFEIFFIIASILGIPSIFLVLFFIKKNQI